MNKIVARLLVVLLLLNAIISNKVFGTTDYSVSIHTKGAYSDILLDNNKLTMNSSSGFKITTGLFSSNDFDISKLSAETLCTLQNKVESDIVSKYNNTSLIKLKRSGWKIGESLQYDVFGNDVNGIDYIKLLDYMRDKSGLESSSIKRYTTKIEEEIDSGNIISGDIVSVSLNDILIAEIFRRCASSASLSDLAELSKYSESITSLRGSAIHSKHLKPMLNKIASNVTNITELKEYFSKLSNAKVDEVIVNLEKSIINDKYIKPLLQGNVLNTNIPIYDKHLISLYALTESNSNETTLLINKKVKEYFSLSGTAKESIVEGTDEVSNTINNLYEQIKIESSYKDQDKSALLSVINQRSSLYSLSKSSIIKSNIVYANAGRDLSSENSASTVLKTFKDVLSSIKDTDMKQKQIYTLNFRLQYLFYAIKNSTVVVDKDIEDLSKTEDGNKYYRGVAPVKLVETPRNYLAYILFNNVINEISFEREIIMKSLSGLSASTSITENITKNVVSLKQLKDAITFLENNSSVLESREVIKYWYDKIDTENDGQMSLEDYYNKSMDLKIDTSVMPKFDKAAESKPLRDFFNLEKSTINGYIQLGMINSATYIPLQTNLYEPHTYRLISNNEFFKFHDKWGYMRKAVYIDTNLSSAVDNYNTGKRGKMKVATLKDMLQPEKDITLYSDTKFYNVHKLADLKNEAFNRLDNVDKDSSTTATNWWSRFWEGVEDYFKIDLVDVTKTAEKTKYAKALKGITNYEESKKDTFKSKMSKKDSMVLDGKYIDSNLEEEDYSVMRSFAIVSSVYRDSELFDFCNKDIAISPVFISSKNLVGIKSTPETLKNTIFNYALLKNIGDNMTASFDNRFDMSAPIYIDIYGNIITESGTVIVPFAANATMNTKYSPYTNAFISTYGNNYLIDGNIDYIDIYDGSNKDNKSDLFELNKEKNKWEFKDMKINSKVSLQKLSTQSNSAMETLKGLYSSQFYSTIKKIDTENYIRNVLMEVLRGAPLDEIDKSKEGLTSSRLTMSGIIQASKLESLEKSIKTKIKNTLIYLPNPAYTEHLDNYFLLAYKITMVMCILLVLIQIFILAMKMTMSWKELGKIAGTVALTITVVYLIPTLFNLTYYASNKVLLQNECEYISILNLEKIDYGIEVGITDITEPVNDSSLLIKIKELNVPWYEFLNDVLHGSVNKTMKNALEEYVSHDPAFGMKDFDIKGNALYMEVNKLFKSSTVVFDTELNTLYQYTDGDVPFSYYSPYYLFLDELIAKINVYNVKTDSYSYTVDTYKGGRIKSLGLIKNYLVSDEFIEKDKDIFGLNIIYGLDEFKDTSAVYSTDILGDIKKSQWVQQNVHKGADAEYKIAKVNEELRKYVMENKNMIGKVSDETVLKGIALHMSIYYNKVFGIDSANSLDIFNISSEDIMRFSILRKDLAMKDYALSMPRFVLENSGESGVYLQAVNDMVTFIVSWIKPLVTYSIFIVVYISIFLYKLVLRKKSDNAKGLILLTCLLCLSNMLYAVLLKIVMNSPNIGLPPAVCILIHILFQIAVGFYYLSLLKMSLLNWTDLAADKIVDSLKDIKNVFKIDAILDTVEKQSKTDKDNTGWRIYNTLKASDEYRKYNVIQDSNRKHESDNGKLKDYYSKFLGK